MQNNPDAQTWAAENRALEYLMGMVQDDAGEEVPAARTKAFSALSSLIRGHAANTEAFIALGNGLGILARTMRADSATAGSAGDVRELCRQQRKAIFMVRYLLFEHADPVAAAASSPLGAMVELAARCVACGTGLDAAGEVVAEEEGGAGGVLGAAGGGGTVGAEHLRSMREDALQTLGSASKEVLVGLEGWGAFKDVLEAHLVTLEALKGTAAKDQVEEEARIVAELVA